MKAQLPVTILTGFLGSGKTTLLKRILEEEHGLRIGVILNEFGEISIDGELVNMPEGGADAAQQWLPLLHGARRF